MSRRGGIRREIHYQRPIQLSSGGGLVPSGRRLNRCTVSHAGFLPITLQSPPRTLRPSGMVWDLVNNLQKTRTFTSCEGRPSCVSSYCTPPRCPASRSRRVGDPLGDHDIARWSLSSREGRGERMPLLASCSRCRRTYMVLGPHSRTIVPVWICPRCKRRRNLPREGTPKHHAFASSSRRATALR